MKKRYLAMLLTGMMVLGGCRTTAPDPNPAPTATEAAEPTEAVEPTETAEPTEAEAPTENAEATPTEAEEETITLKEVFGAHGMKAGTCMTAYDLRKKQMTDLILANFNSITCGNEMKPDYVLNQRKSREEGHVVVEYGKDTLAILDWCKENNMSMRGHTLVWYSQTPEWLFHEDFDITKPLVDREELLTRMEDMIKGNFEQLETLGYIDMFYAYDVINEGWMEDGTPRSCHWYDIIGDDYFWYAFYFANNMRRRASTCIITIIMSSSRQILWRSL